MVQVLQDIADMSVYFERSQGYSVPTFEVNQTSSYNNCNFSYSYRSTKPSAREAQQSTLKADKLKFWHCQGNHLKKDCSTTSQQNSSLQSKPKISKEKQCNFIKSFHKRFQDKEITGQWDYHNIWRWQLQWSTQSILLQSLKIWWVKMPMIHPVDYMVIRQIHISLIKSSLKVSMPYAKYR